VLKMKERAKRTIAVKSKVYFPRELICKSGFTITPDV
jgi:hypothetical protein